MEPSRRTRILACVSAAVGAFVALTFVMATPTKIEAYSDNNGQVVMLASHYRPVAIVLVIIQAVALIATVVGLVAAARRTDRIATRSFEVAAVTGLVPTVVPGVLAFLARRLVVQSSKPA
jgi:hypothetical protein